MLWSDLPYELLLELFALLSITDNVIPNQEYLMSIGSNEAFFQILTTHASNWSSLVDMISACWISC